MNVTKPCVSSCNARRRHQVIDAILVGFDVAVQHRAVGMQPQLMRRARHVEPLVAGDFVIANDAADALVENLGAAAGQ